MPRLSAKLKRRLVFAAKLFIFLAVVAGIGRTVWNALDEFEEQQFSLLDVDGRWVAAAGLAYLVGMLPAWLFWHQTLRSMKQRPTLGESFRAHYMSHLGKYVPGKAMVVIIRTGVIRSDRVDAKVAATSVFIEVLTLMAVGSLIAAAILGTMFRDQTVLVGAALVLMMCAAVPTWPPLFRRVVRLLLKKWATPDLDDALAGVNYRLMVTGWAMLAATWCFYGVSLWAVLSAMPGPSPEHSHLPLLIACISLATVAGFVSMIPGGVGVREFVMIPLLEPAFGPVNAIVSAILLRLAWLLSEVSVLTILYVGNRFRKKQPDAPRQADNAPQSDTSPSDLAS